MIFSNTKKIAVLSLMLVFVFSFLMSTPANASNSEKRRIEHKRLITRQKINRLKILETQETNKLYRNQIKLEKSTRVLNESKQQYSSTQVKLSDLERDLSYSLQTFSTSESNTRHRIRQIYKKQRSGLFQLLLSTTDINEFLDRIYYQNIIAKRDKKNLVYVKERARRIARLKYQAEEQKRILQGAIESINYQKQSIQSAINKNSSMIQKLRTDRLAYERAEKELARQSANLENMISRNAGDSTIKITSGFIRPVGGGITSSFGWRIHPIFKSRTFHSGLDIGAPYGSAVRASNSGRVIYAGWYGGYGKVVILDHGRYNGVPVTTLYAHLSSYNVGVGDTIVRGQSVGRVGSTGYSTGPHLHFEVRVKGQPTNPLSYI